MMFDDPRHTRIVFDAVWDERDHQDAKWGTKRTHPFIAPLARAQAVDAAAFYCIPTPAAAQSICDRRHRAGIGTWTDILIEEVAEAVDALANQPTLAHARAELIQVAAVAVAIVEAIDRDDALVPR